MSKIFEQINDEKTKQLEQLEKERDDGLLVEIDSEPQEGEFCHFCGHYFVNKKGIVDCQCNDEKYQYYGENE